jgi:isopenicillin N synthase-like dioxygenase
VKVHPPDYCMVINLGDLFNYWTNDSLKSTIHKVEVDDEIFKKIKNG